MSSVLKLATSIKALTEKQVCLVINYILNLKINIRVWYVKKENMSKKVAHNILRRKEKHYSVTNNAL